MTKMTTRMKIDQPLPSGFASKWKRLLASQDGDPEALALAAVELLWKKYGREVERQERAVARMNKQIEKTKKRLDEVHDRTLVARRKDG